MKGIDKATCRKYLEPLTAPNSDCGLFLVKSLKYIVRTAIKIVGHRRLLVLCLYARGNTPGDRPVLTFTMFQASDSFITYDHRSDSKTRWRTAMLANLERDYHFLQNECAFYSRPDEERVIHFCAHYASERHSKEGFWALNDLQSLIREKEHRHRQRVRELKIRARMCGLRPIPKDVGIWLVREAVPAYFFYDYQKGKEVKKGICSACGHEVELTKVRHNAHGVCPNCGRPLTMKSNGRRGYIWDRVTASVIQKFHEGEVMIRIIKAYSDWPKAGPQELSWYEETRIIVGLDEGGKAIREVYHDSRDSVGVTSWKKGYPPVMYLYGRNFNAETCGAVYVRNLSKELAGTPWQYCQLEAFYTESKHEAMEVLPYLEGYLEHPRLEHLVKVGFNRLASDLVYRGDYNHTLDESRNRTHQILRVMAEDIPFLRGLDTSMELLREFQKYCDMNLKGRQELLLWQIEHDVKFDILQILEHMTPHKMIRFLGEQYPLLREKKAQYGGTRYSSMQDMVREYRDYLEMCVKEHYDMGNSFVLFPKDLQVAHDKVARRVKQRADAKMRRDFKTAYRRIMAQLDFEMDGMKIVYPSTPSDIVAEGHALHHCVGSYVERVAQKECLILFLRKCEDEAKPFYTIEVRHKEVVQVRGMRNEDATPEVKKFMAQWEKRVLKRAESLPKAA